VFLLAFVVMGLPDFESKCTSSRPPTKIVCNIQERQRKTLLRHYQHVTIP